MAAEYTPSNIEPRWQAYWEENQTFRTPNPGEPGFDATRPKFYALDMFPYPSGAGLHVGHPEGYTATDIISRYKRMKGCNVLHPMGWDAFGLPAEQYAIQTGVHPAVTTRTAIDNFRRQLKAFGFCYDWSREFGTIDPDYYKWTQWIFVQIYNSWFDTKTHMARPIHELIAELESGRREPVVNPNAAEYANDENITQGLNWKSLDAKTRRKVIDSYRLAYLAEQTVNWCPKLGTALANEEVIDGKSERGGYPVFRKPLRQWMFRITAYAERLLSGLASVEWPEMTRTLQTNWIGRSEGAEIDFPLLDASGGKSGDFLRVFTTRPDTVFGATYMVVAPEHDLVESALANPTPETNSARLRDYVDWARNRSDVDRQESKEKTGVFTGAYAFNPLTEKPIPVWTADYVLMGYGTGAIMAVPAQDQRDWDFAKTFDLPIVRTVQPTEGFDGEAFVGEGPAINSGFLDGLNIADAKRCIIDWLEENNVGRSRINFKLRDWLFSRQRYWGEPFPIVFDEEGNHHAVSEDALPVELPPLADYQPVESDEPTPLLGKATDWLNTTAGEANIPGLPADAKVRRETNTMPGWAGSCWYYLRYCDPKNGDKLIGDAADTYWMGDNGVDLYIGGAEHAVLHLLYARFWHMILHDLGHVRTKEPFGKLFHQGLITSFAFKDSENRTVPVDEVEERNEKHYLKETGEQVEQIVAKMSKTLKNVVNPDDIIREFGADTFRLYEMYMGPLEASKPWNTKDTVGLFRFLRDIWRLCIDIDTNEPRVAEAADAEVEKHLHKTIAKVGNDIERLAFNTAIAAMFEFKNTAQAAQKRQSNGNALTRDQIDRLTRILAPFAPHMAEELWHKLDAGHGSVALADWPTYDEAMLIEAEIEIPVQINGKLIDRIKVPKDADEGVIKSAAMERDKVTARIGDGNIVKTIYVPGRMLNLIVK
ncbi:MAG TPA: leucine--tRNA ligase [Phycisphaerae bacterium]|nr:leucine--tRNA ligase [Phycisphaerae bacterium]HRW55908.1 leucine--tRNA ligase [Phycisphaerae bacterium]